MTAKAASAPIRLYLVDGSGYLFRAYHALPPLTRKSDGTPVGAVSGYSNMLYKLLCDMSDEHDPTHLAVIFDHSSKTFRNELYPEYKAHRPEPPEDLIPQFPLVRDATRAFNVACIEAEGFEADDIIATYARMVEAKGGDVVIISSDKDLMQLVSDRISLYDTMKNRRIGREEVIEKFGVPPDQVVNVLGTLDADAATEFLGNNFDLSFNSEWFPGINGLLLWYRLLSLLLSFGVLIVLVALVWLDPAAKAAAAAFGHA